MTRARALALLRWCSCRSFSTDTFVPATLNRLDVVERAPIVHSYLSNGFIIRSSVVYGSVGLLPRGFFNWKVKKLEDLAPESFSLFHLIEPRLELLVLGTGAKVEKVDHTLIQFLKKKGISLEVQDTPNACATFNFLLDEGRPAGAALIPLQHIPV